MQLKRYRSDIIKKKTCIKHDNLLGVDNDYDAILCWLREQSNPNTLKSYSLAVERFYMWLYCTRKKQLNQIRRNDLLDYKDFLAAPDPLLCGPAYPRSHPDWKPFVKGLSLSSIKNQCLILKSLFNYLYHSGYLACNYGIFLKVRYSFNNYKQDNYLEMNDYLTFRKLLADYYKNDSIRYTFLFDVLFYTGLRRSEVANATQADIIFKLRDRGFWLRVTGKGNKYAEIPIPEQLLHEIDHYRMYWGLSSFPSPTESQIPLIIKSSKKQGKTIKYHGYSESAIYKIICKQYRIIANLCNDKVLAARLRTLSCHSLRHSYATALCDFGVELRTVKANMRHSNIETTMRYMHIDDSKRHRETQKFGSRHNSSN